MATKRHTLPHNFPWWRSAWDRVLLLLILGGFMLFYPGQNIYTVYGGFGNLIKKTASLPIPVPAPYPTNITGYYPTTEATADGVIVYDINSGVYLYKRNETELLSPASTTKILTALVALESYGLDDVLTVKTATNGGQVMGLIPGERITLENLLYGALVQSGNDAAYALADNYSGGVEGFVAAMNKKAKEIHLDNSTFTNPMGFDDPGHKMTPIDLTRLATVALANKTIAKMVAIPQITVSDVTHTYFHQLKNVNQLLGKIPGVGGIKTGWTEEAGENLVTLVERNGHRVIIVVLRSVNRFNDTEFLINWVFGNYEWKEYKTGDRV